MQIGFFDSGIGGFTVLKEALKVLPDENYLYYADTLHVPYGTKPKDEVRHYVLDAVDFMVGQGIKALVVACNTATIVAINDLRNKYDFPIIGMEPAVKPAVEKNKDNEKRVIVMATPLALKEEKFHSLVTRLDCEHIVDLLPLPELVEFAEGFVFDESIICSYLKGKLSSYDLSQYGTVVLGCTHFPLYKSTFRKVLPEHIDIIDGSSGTVRHLKNVLAEKGLDLDDKGNGEVIFYTSGIKETNKEKLEKYRQLLNL